MHEYKKKSTENVNRRLYLKSEADIGYIKNSRTMIFDENAIRLTQSMADWCSNGKENMRNITQRSVSSLREHKNASISLKKSKSKREVMFDSKNKLQILVQNRKL